MASIGSRTGVEKAGPGITSRSIKRGGINADRLHSDVASEKYLLFNGQGQPLIILASMAAVASGGDATEHVAYLPGSNHPLHYWPIGAIAGAFKGPAASASGLRLDFDAASGDGGNYVPGGNIFTLRVEQDAGQTVPEGVFIRARFKIEDVSGTADFAIGFRKSEAVQAAIDDYDEMAALNVQSGTINTETILNAGATVTRATGYTWADNETHELLVVCQGNGKVFYYVDGRQVGIDFQFDDAEVVTPFMFVLQAADLTEMRMPLLEVGYVGQRNSGVHILP